MENGVGDGTTKLLKLVTAVIVLGAVIVLCAAGALVWWLAG